MKKWGALFIVLSVIFTSDLVAQTNGRNVKVVNYPNGRFEQTGAASWTEFTAKKNKIQFRETMRDEWSVYLIDDRRNLTIQLDLYKKEIYIHWDRPNRTRLYKITGSSQNRSVTKTKQVTSKGPKGYKKAVDENGTRFFSQPVDVAYGANGKFVFRKNMKGYISFNNATFGDPAPGVPKAGYFRAASQVATSNQKKLPPKTNKSAVMTSKQKTNAAGTNKIAAASKNKQPVASKKKAPVANSKKLPTSNKTKVANTSKKQLPQVNKTNTNNKSTGKAITNKVVETIEKSPIAPADMALVMEWIAAEVADDKIAYCYKESYGRGVGEPLSVCPEGTEKNGLLCYPKCREGFSGGGPVCWQNCPNGFRNDPAHCGKPKEYGRGTGYALHFGEFDLDGAMKRCRSEHPQGCEQHGLLIYPKCKPGFHPVGCCICSPNCPEGMTDIGVSCEKGSYGRGVGEPMVCPPGMEQDGALCYEPCKEGYVGVGPVCWRKCPPNQPVDCGAGCAKSTADCVEKTANMVTAVAELAANIASMGSTSGFTAAKAGVKTSIKAGNKVAAKMYMKRAVKELAQGFQQLTTRKVAKKLKQKFREDALEWVKNEYAAVQMKLIMQEEFTADDLRIFAGLDPTGAAQVVEAFWQPICAEPNPFPTLSKSYE